MPADPKPVISEQSDGSVQINYKPVDKGVHELHLTYNDKTVTGMRRRCVMQSVCMSIDTVMHAAIVMSLLTDDSKCTATASMSRCICF